jgi:hypothetical protein
LRAIWNWKTMACHFSCAISSLRPVNRRIWSLHVSFSWRYPQFPAHLNKSSHRFIYWEEIMGNAVLRLLVVSLFPFKSDLYDPMRICQQFTTLMPAVSPFLSQSIGRKESLCLSGSNSASLPRWKYPRNTDDHLIKNWCNWEIIICRV